MEIIADTQEQAVAGLCNLMLELTADTPALNFTITSTFGIPWPDEMVHDVVQVTVNLLDLIAVA